jgi:DNA-directed RNA polymerase specialized sigma24 family protein
MACRGRILVWWDRGFDASGRAIRPDARSAGRDLWEQACKQTIAAIHDVGPAAELMENAVAQVSRYLDRTGAPLSPRKHGLLMVVFCRALRRYAAKSARLELLGGTNDVSGRTVDDGWLARTNARLELERIVRQLSDRNAEVLMLRAAGFEWKQIAQIFGTSAAAVRNSFWREIGRIRWKLAGQQECHPVPTCATLIGYVPVSRNSDR